MKRNILKTGTALLLMTLLLAGCGNRPEAPAEDTQLPPETVQIQPSETAAETLQTQPAETEKAFDPERFLQEIQPALACLDALDMEQYGAAADFDTIYSAAIRDGQVESLYPAFDPIQEGCEPDPGGRTFYPVSNFHTVAEVRAYCAQYMTDEILDSSSLSDSFLEYEGMLYLVRWGKGYGELRSDPQSAVYLGEKDGMQQIQLTYNLFDQFYADAVISFLDTEEGWKLAAIENLN